MALTLKKPNRYSKRLKKLAEINTIKQTLTELLPDTNTGNEFNDNLHVIIKRCPICGVIFDSVKSRQKHEKLTHFVPAEDLPLKSVKEPKNLSMTKQQEFLLTLNLVNNSLSKSWSVMDILASRPHVLKSFRAQEGAGNAIGQYKCHYCEYKTVRTFILWAHITTCHNEPIREKISNPYCFFCNRFITKRTSFLKHFRSCLESQKIVEEPQVRRYSCDLCDKIFDSVSDLERHLYYHVAIARANKNYDNNNNNNNNLFKCNKLCTT